jgi:hypothetical protein
VYTEVSGLNRQTAVPGMFIPFKSVQNTPPVRMQCLISSGELITASQATYAAANPFADTITPVPVDESENALSTGFLLTYGAFQIWFGGDLTHYQEPRLVNPVNLIGDVDVLLMHHHGLPVSNDPVFLKSLRPEVCIYSNSWKKGLSLPNVQAVAATPTVQAVYQLHKNLSQEGDVHSPSEYRANIRDEKEGNYIKLSVDARSVTYTVAVGRTADPHLYTFD